MHRSSVTVVSIIGGVLATVVAVVGCQRLAWKKWKRSCGSTQAVVLHSTQSETRAVRQEPPTILIMYATCGGTAKGFAVALHDLLVDRGVQGVELVHDDAIALFEARFVHGLLPPRVVLAVVSTSGEGQIPPSFGRQWAMLRHAACSKSVLRGQKHDRSRACSETLALGDSSYRFFCRAGVETAEMLSSIGYGRLISDKSEEGGNSSLSCTVCDAAGVRSQEAIFSEWCNRVIGGLLDVGIPVGPQPLHAPRRRHDISLLSRGPTEAAHSSTGVDSPFALAPSMMEPSRARPACLPVRGVVQCLPPSSPHPIAQVTLDLSHHLRMKYEAGDHLGLLVPNPPSEVQRLIKFFATQLGQDCSELVDLPMRVQQKSVAMARASAANVFPVATTTLRMILTWYVDISAVPSTAALRHIIRCSAASDAEKLRMLDVLEASPWMRATSDGASQSTVRMVDVLDRYFPLCASCPLDRAFECIPPLQPRLYSIGSDPVSHSDGSLQVYVRLVPNGIASGYLESVPSEVFGFIQKSEFHLPRNHQRPLLLIGPGTGLAPLLGFLHRRLGQQRKRPNSSLCGPTLLMHGCREESDWTHSFNSMVQPFLMGDAPVLTDVDVCLSREPGKPKRYVQDALSDRGPHVAQLLASREVAIFVCGDAKRMAKGVWQTFVKLLQEHAGYSAEMAESLLTGMVKEKRYFEDVW